MGMFSGVSVLSEQFVKGPLVPRKGRGIVAVQVLVESSEAEVFSLLDELHSVSQNVAFLNPGEQEPGTLGGVVESIELVLTSGTVVGAVAKVLVTWLRTRQTTTKITLKNRDGDSYVVEGPSASAEAQAELLREMRAFFERSGLDETP